MTAAHFFWDGPITTMQHLAFLSAKDAGFDVTVWSTMHHELPSGINAGNATEILDSSIVADVNYHKVGISPRSKEEEDIHSKYALYSDFFRAALLSKIEGWWFDSDCVILKPVQDWDELSYARQIVAGIEPRTGYNIANGILKINDLSVSSDFFDFLVTSLHEQANPSWASLGPYALTKYIVDNGYQNDVLPSDVFYPIPTDSAGYLYSTDSGIKSKCYAAVESSYAFHWWNSLAISDVYQNNPPIGSFLDDFLIKHGLRP